MVTMLAVALSLTFMPAAHADPATPEAYSEAAITKVLRVPVGTAVPTTNFTFNFTPVSVNSDTSLASTMPPIGTSGVVTIPFTPTTSFTHTETVGDVDFYYLESAPLLGTINWPDTGIYEYTISENAGTYTGTDTMTYSDAQYTMRVHVREYKTGDIIPPGKAVGNLYIFAIGVVRIVEEGGDPGTDKVDPTPGSLSTLYDYSQVTFTNTFTKNNGDPDDPDPINNRTLGVSKTTSGHYASSSAYFDFTMTVTKPSLVASATYHAYIIDTNGAIINGSALADNNVTAAGVDINGNSYIAFGSGAQTTFSLKSGQTLAFTNTHVGASYIISEAGSAGYTPSAIITSNGIAAPAVTAAEGASLAIPVASAAAPLVGEAANSADFTNTNDGMSETGINMNNLPYYLLFALALIALGGFVAFKVRKRSVEN